jgi:hypothetical protein
MPDRKNILNESQAEYQILSDEERLKRNIYRSDMDKFRLFTKMLRSNIVLKKAVITHK